MRTAPTVLRRGVLPTPSDSPHHVVSGRTLPWKRALALMLCVLSLHAPRAGAQAPLYPPDFSVSAGAGSVMGEHPRRLVVINSDGSGVYCYTSPADRDTAVCTTSSAFSLTVANLNTIWSAVTANAFFTLADSVSTTDTDGTYAHLSITAAAMTHEVSTQNLTHAAFDAIMITINSVLLSPYRLKYNAIAP
jgi:hypothetical protein